MIVIQPFFNMLAFGLEPTLGNLKHLTATDILKLPVNCVMEGQQQPNKRAMELKGITGPLKGVFGE